jgi:predicted PurR-regulated permease PerM
MPPALILIGQLFMGALTGAWGIILATPVVAVIIVVIKEVYLKEKKKPIETITRQPPQPSTTT